MANQISMTPSEMRAGAKTALKTAGIIQNDVINTMDNLLERLEASWKGEAVRGYSDRYNQTIKPALNNAVELMDEINKNLITTAKITEDTDRNIAAQYRRNN